MNVSSLLWTKSFSLCHWDYLLSSSFFHLPLALPAFFFFFSPLLWSRSLLTSFFLLLLSWCSSFCISLRSLRAAQENLTVICHSVPEKEPSVLSLCGCGRNVHGTRRLSACLCAPWIIEVVIRRYLWEPAGQLLPADRGREEGWRGKRGTKRNRERWQRREKHAQSVHTSYYYQLALQAGCGCYGNWKGGE